MDSRISIRLLPLSVAFVIGAVAVSGCANAGREVGESKLNEFIGKSVEGTYLETSPYVERVTGPDTTRYIQKGLYGCDIEFIVETQSKRVKAWQYLSSPNKCWKSKGSY